MVNVNEITTAPKPFIFVLMPFDSAFDDIYRFGIKGAAHEVGAYAERVDEQMFDDGILDRIFNQISRADVIVADMTGRNPNVFYEVGYAHALGKIVLLLTQRTADIPFDLSHRQHTVYGGSIESLRKDLVPKLTWAIAEARRRTSGAAEIRFSLRLGGVTLVSEDTHGHKVEIAQRISEPIFALRLQLRNDSPETLPAITHTYLFMPDDTRIVPTATPPEGDVFRMTSLIVRQKGEPQWIRPRVESFAASAVDAADGLTQQFRLPLRFPAVPPGAVEEAALHMHLVEPPDERVLTTLCRLRLHSAQRFHDYPFVLSVTPAPKPMP